jgi:RNA polymerase sigma-70 factor (ECF subfamily)
VQLIDAHCRPEVGAVRFVFLTQPPANLRHLDTRQRSTSDVATSERYDRRPEGDVDALTAAVNAATSADGDLVRRARTGDAAAFRVLVDTRIDRCYRLAWSILSNDADAADATQDALVLAWRQLPRLRDAAVFDSWLNRIVANAALMARRHRVRLREVSARPAYPGLESPQPEPAQDLHARTPMDEMVDNDAIGRAFDRLRPKDRMILVLHHVEERPVAEIARSLGIPVGTAKWRLHAARTALEKAMEAEA